MPEVEGVCRERMNALALGGPELDEVRNLFPVERVAPAYPRWARWRGVQGWACVEAQVESDGSVSQVWLLDARPESAFGDAAHDAVAQWKYPPREPPGARNVFVFLSFAAEGGDPEESAAK